jgi:hypothetical protein
MVQIDPKNTFHAQTSYFSEMVTTLGGAGEYTTKVDDTT